MIDLQKTETEKPKKKSSKELRDEKKAAGLVPITRKYKVMGSRQDFDLLDKMAREVNLVWNYCNAVSRDLLLQNTIHNQNSETLQVDVLLKGGDGKIGYSLEFLKSEGVWTIRYSDIVAPPIDTAIDPQEVVRHYFAYRNLKDGTLTTLPQLLSSPRSAKSDFFNKNINDYYIVIVNSAFAGKKGQKLPATEFEIGYNPEGKRGYKGVEILKIKNGHANNYDLHKLLAGSKLSIGSATFQAVASQYCIDKMGKFKKIGKGEANPIGIGSSPLRRRDGDTRPWIPVDGSSIDIDFNNCTLRFLKNSFCIRGGYLAEDITKDMKPTVAKFVKEGGKWFVSIFFNIKGYEKLRKPVEIVERPIGIDPGVKTMIVDDAGEEYGVSYGNVRIFGKEMHLQDALEYVQSKLSKHKNRTGVTKPIKRGGKTVVMNVKPHKTEAGNLKFPRLSNKLKMLEGVFAKLTAQKRRRIEYQHYMAIMTLFKKGNEFVIGDVSAKWIQAVHGKKSAENSLGLFKTRLAWMCKKYGMEFHETKEAYSTVTCHKCNAQTGPSGIKDLSVRSWTCSSCGEIHDRDTNAARNILKFYLDRLAKEAKSEVTSEAS